MPSGGRKLPKRRPLRRWMDSTPPRTLRQDDQREASGAAVEHLDYM